MSIQAVPMFDPGAFVERLCDNLGLPETVGDLAGLAFDLAVAPQAAPPRVLELLPALLPDSVEDSVEDRVEDRALEPAVRDERGSQDVELE